MHRGTLRRGQDVYKRQEQEGAITSEWGVSDTNRKAKFYKLTRAGRRQLERETQDWEQTTAILARFLSPAEEA